jgi:hypothetical protein
MKILLNKAFRDRRWLKAGFSDLASFIEYLSMIHWRNCLWLNVVIQRAHAF